MPDGIRFVPLEQVIRAHLDRLFAGEEIVADGRVTVKNPAEPPEGIVTVELEEVWRLGGDVRACRRFGPGRGLHGGHLGPGRRLGLGEAFADLVGPVRQPRRCGGRGGR